MTQHESRTLRHPVVRRQLQVLEVLDLSPHMRRIVLGGPELEGFHSASPDDHIKMFFPNPDGAFVTPILGPNGPELPVGAVPSPMRDYTPRLHDAAAARWRWTSCCTAMALPAAGPRRPAWAMPSCWAGRAARSCRPTTTTTTY